MDILPLHFRILYYGGLWWETEKQYWLAKYIWKPLVINIEFFCAFMLISPLAAPEKGVKDVPQLLFLSLTVFGLIFKIFNFLAKRESMMELLNTFRESTCVPQTPEETYILKKNAQLIPIMIKGYLFISYLSGTTFLLLPLLHFKKGTGQMNVPFETYEIFSKDNVPYYAVTYAFQVVATVTSIGLSGSFDTILAGFAHLTCGQIELCCHRFASGNRGSVLVNIKTCVEHHIVIQNIVRRLESIFMNVVVPLLSISLITICTSVYNLSQIGFGRVESIPFLAYTGAMLAQVFFYGWFGTELILKGMTISETLYNYDWRGLTLLEKKNLLFIMVACQKPLSFSFHGYCTLSMDIFVWILNASYAAYNILQAIITDS